MAKTEPWTRRGQVRGHVVSGHRRLGCPTYIKLAVSHHQPLQPAPSTELGRLCIRRGGVRESRGYKLAVNHGSVRQRRDELVHDLVHGDGTQGFYPLGWGRGLETQNLYGAVINPLLVVCITGRE